MVGDVTRQPRLLGLWPTMALVVGTLIGSGIYGLPAQLAPFGWNALFGWAITIAGALCLAYVFARLSQALPAAAGPYAFAEQAFGRPAAFAVAWSYWVSLWVGNAAIAASAVSYASRAFPALGAVGAGPVVAIALLWLLTLLNCVSLRAAGGFQLVTTVMKLVPLLLVIGIAAMLLASGGEAAGPRFDPAALDGAAINGAAALTLWALLGFEAAAWGSRNVRDPLRNVPRATLGGTIVVALLYLLVSTALAAILPADQLAASDAPIALFVERAWGSDWGVAIALFGAVSVIGALNGLILLQGELPLAMARDGAFPRWFARTSPGGRPVRSLIASSILATILVLVMQSRSMAEIFHDMILWSTAAILVLYFIVALASLELQRRNLIETHPALLVTGGLGLIYALWTFWGAGWQAMAFSLAMIAAGIPVYILSRLAGRAEVAPDDSAAGAPFRSH